jgi:subtilisin-like proprotein convertase family protein
MLALLVLAPLLVLPPTAANAATTLTFTNATPITIPDSGAATPYPATIVVSGVGGVVTGITLQLSNLSHSHPDDLDILLAGPGGLVIPLMSDAGGGTDVTNLTLTFTWRPPFLGDPSVPDEGPLTAGPWSPTNYPTDETIPDPAPPFAWAGCIRGLHPNGAWDLYVTDDTGGDSGQLAGGWTLSLDIVADTIPPTTTVSAWPAPNAAGWNRSAKVSVSLPVSDEGGSLTRMMHTEGEGANPLPAQDCEANCGSALAAVWLPDITAEGETLITFWATDYAGNQENPTTYTVGLDRTKPFSTPPQTKLVAGYRLDPTKVPVMLFAWSGSDPDPGPGPGQVPSGLDRYWLLQSLDGGGWTTLTIPAKLATSSLRFLNRVV